MQETQITHVNSCRSFIQEQEPLHTKNWFGTGGNACYYAQPTSTDEFKQALCLAQTVQLPVFVLGEGANCLISDTGFNGMIIRPQLCSIEAKELSKTTAHVTAGAGVSMAQLIEYCLAHNYVGLEEFSGIPGTVGGSVYINLHYFSFLIEQFLVRATTIDAITGEINIVTTDWFQFRYDYSKLHAKKQFLLDATFVLARASDAETIYARGRAHEIVRHRSARYPTKSTCGSFFRNFHEDEVTVISNGRKMIYAAYYLDKVNVKGTLQVGDAIVSYQHANMIVNMGCATSTDIISVARQMQERVYQQFGVLLQPECQLIGFDEYPLHTHDTL